MRTPENYTGGPTGVTPSGETRTQEEIIAGLQAASNGGSGNTKNTLSSKLYLKIGVIAVVALIVGYYTNKKAGLVPALGVSAISSITIYMLWWRYDKGLLKFS